MIANASTPVRPWPARPACRSRNPMRSLARYQRHADQRGAGVKRERESSTGTNKSGWSTTAAVLPSILGCHLRRPEPTRPRSHPSLGQLASVGRRAVCKSCDCARRRATSTTMAATQCPSSNRAVVGSLPARRRSQKRRLPPGPPVRLQSHGPRIRPGPKCLGLPAHPHGPAGRPTSGVTGGQPGRGVVGGWRSLRGHLVLDPGGKLVWDGGHGCVAQQVAGQPRVTIR